MTNPPPPRRSRQAGPVPRAPSGSSAPEAPPLRISVVTATLNAAAFLPECVESVRGQGGDGFVVEHVIADGGSTDDTVSIAREGGCLALEGEDDGVFDALNRGVRASSGEVVGWLGGDDVLVPGALQAVARWHAGRRAEWMVGGLSWIDGHGRSLGTLHPPPPWLPVRAFASLGWCCIPHHATYMTRRFFEELGGFDPGLVTADYRLLCEALARMPFDRVGAIISAFRMHGENVSVRAEARGRRENAATARAYGPRSPALRQAFRLCLKVYVNARNPAWFRAKRRWVQSGWRSLVRSRSRGEGGVREAGTPT